MAIDRLYSKLHPEKYTIKIAIDRSQKTIAGTVWMTAEALADTVFLHQKDLVIDKVLVNGTPHDFSVDNDEQTVKITNVTPGKITLEVAYHTKLTDTMMGIYPSYYHVDGIKKQIIGTQFETTFARQAFPCVDEPEAKAIFELAIKFDEHAGETILANMPEAKTEVGYHYFEPTVKMSSYLVAFAFGELQQKTTTTKSGVKVGVFATKAHKADELDFALDIAKRSIDFYEEFYHTKYPLPHSWQLALPDFSAGAMENWGLVTYREAYLLLDQNNATLTTKRIVASVIAHELAHQWFGDLVTMKWWDDLWLNESFANMMEYVCVDALEPSWKMWELFQTSEVPSALNRDATFGVQPVHVAVNDPAEIDALFDGAIVYAKGARMLVMVRSLIGDDALRKGLTAYFEKHQYNNACGDDLWDALGTAANMNIGEIMHGWLSQPGYPVVKLAVDDNGQVVATQRQFNIGKQNPDNQTWQIPLNANFTAPKLLTQTSQILGDYQALRKTAPLLLNHHNDAHFIVDYDATLRQDIFANLDKLSAIDQRAFLHNQRLLATANQLNFATITKSLDAFKNATSAIVCDEVFASLNQLKMFVLDKPAAKANLNALFGKVFAKNAARLGWNEKLTDSNDDQLIRPLALAASLKAKNDADISFAHTLFESHNDKLIDLPAAIRGLVLQNEVIHFEDDKLIEKLLNLYHQTPNASFKNHLQKALCAATNPKTHDRLLEAFKDANIIKPQDLRAWYVGLLANESAQAKTWQWLVDNWDWLEAKIGGDMEFATFLTVTANVFATEKHLEAFKQFFEPKKNTPGLKREIIMDVEKITAKAALIKQQQASVIAALAE